MKFEDLKPGEIFELSLKARPETIVICLKIDNTPYIDIESFDNNWWVCLCDELSEIGDVDALAATGEWDLINSHGIIVDKHNYQHFLKNVRKEYSEKD